jgi:hypothetical protein
MWHGLGLLGVFWLAFLATLNQVTSGTVLLVGLLFAVWGLLVITGVALQGKYFSSLLY